VVSDGKHDVGQHAPILRAVAVGTIELLHGDFDRTEIQSAESNLKMWVRLPRGSGRSLTMSRFVTDDQAPLVVLNGPGQNFTGAGTEAAGEHHERSIPGGTRLDVALYFHFAHGILDLDDRSAIDKQARDSNRFGQASSAVAAQVEHDGVEPSALNSSRSRRTSRVELL
jgi:hypothetical protein